MSGMQGRCASFQVEREKRRAAAQAAAEYQKANQNQGWLGWLWGGGGDKPTSQQSGGDADERADLTQEEYHKLEEIVSEQEAAVKQGLLLAAELFCQVFLVLSICGWARQVLIARSASSDTRVVAASTSPHSLQMELRLKVGSSSFVLKDDQGLKAARAGMEGLWLTAQKYPETLAVGVSLDGVGLVSPEGTIARAGVELHVAEVETAEDTGGFPSPASLSQNDTLWSFSPICDRVSSQSRPCVFHSCAPQRDPSLLSPEMRRCPLGTQACRKLRRRKVREGSKRWTWSLSRSRRTSVPTPC